MLDLDHGSRCDVGLSHSPLSAYLVWLIHSPSHGIINNTALDEVFTISFHVYSHPVVRIKIN